MDAFRSECQKLYMDHGFPSRARIFILKRVEQYDQKVSKTNFS